MRRTMIYLAFVCTVACGDEGPTPVAPTPTSKPSPNPSPSPAPVSTTFRATGTVVEIEGGPVADATVRAFNCSMSNLVLGQTLTDVSGRFTLEVQSPSGPCLLVQKEGYAAGRSNYNEPIDGITLRIQRLRRATGTVVEVDGGPVAGARVWAPGTAALTDANGRFVLDGVGEWLSAQAEGYLSNGISVPEGHDMAVGTVRIQRQILISRGTGFAGRISSNDIDIDLWDEGNWCTCKWIDLDTGGLELIVRLQWSGENPLLLLAAEGGYGPYKGATGKPGESAVSIVVSAATRYLVVGVRNQASVFQPPLPHTQPPVAFELTTSVP